MKVKGNAPQWAIDLIEQVCKENSRKLPLTLRWMNLNRKSSSGTFYWYTETITIRAGTDKEDVKHVILHELGHHLNAKSRKHRRKGHTVRFWKIAMSLYEQYGDMSYSVKREKNYRAFSQVVYERHFKKEA